jgi:mono/diheme cytochrome c family protein
MRWRALSGLVVVLAACAAPAALSPLEPPRRTSFDPALVAKGGQLAAIGNCASCHTARGGKSYAGGRPLSTPFGTVYGTNITPDPQTGIGQWSEAAFLRAMREGLDREGRHLYPAFPYEYFTRLEEADLKALYAFIMTREPVREANRPHELRFPFNVRALIGIWKRRYFEPGVFRPDPARDAQWNRGAYLVHGLGHCGACHTPRDALGGEKKREILAGGEAGGWHGPALNSQSPAPVPWSAEQLYSYLRTGLDEQHAIAAGPMAPVVRNLADVAEGEVRAMAVYLGALGGPPTPERQKNAEAALAQAKAPGREPPGVRGAAVYAGACAFCHDRGRDAGSGGALHLALATAVTIPTSANLLRITLEGIAPPAGAPGRVMPGYADALSDVQVKDLMAYLREHFGRSPPWSDVDQELRKLREDKK